MACGVEMMSRVPLGAAMKDGNPMGVHYNDHYQPASQFMGAAMIAEEYQITRAHTDQFGLESQQKAIQAWEEGRFDREVVAITAPVLGEDFKPTGETRVVSKDEGLRGAVETMVKRYLDADRGIWIPGNFRCDDQTCTLEWDPKAETLETVFPPVDTFDLKDEGDESHISNLGNRLRRQNG